MTVLRVLGFLGLLVAAGFIWLRLGPTISTSSSYESLVAAALSDSTLNNLGAQGAPQQTVVNGWVARDLLAIIAREQADALAQSGGDTRIPALILVGVLALIWHGLTLPRQVIFAPARPDGAGPVPEPA